MAFDKALSKIIVDLVVLVFAAFPLLVILLWVEPYHVGYIPDDPTLRLPYKSENIPTVALVLVGFAVNIATIVLIEIFRDMNRTNVGKRMVAGKLVPGWAWECYVVVGAFIFGAVCQQLTVDVGKNVIGRLRPHFFDLCQPVPSTDSELNTVDYIVDFTCTVNFNSTSLMKNMRRSFPSGHSAFSMYAAIFLILYIQERGKWWYSKLLRHCIQLAIFLAAWYVALSRVTNNMHHWSDVTAGILIGTLIAILVFKYVLKPKKYGLPMTWQQSHQMDNALPRPAEMR